VVAGGFYLVKLVCLLRREARTAEDMGHACDGVQRCPNLVTHIGQESTFGDICGFGGFFGDKKFFRTSFNGVLQVLLILKNIRFCRFPDADVFLNGHNLKNLPAFVCHRIGISAQQ
jgi:hypothetical protein